MAIQSAGLFWCLLQFVKSVGNIGKRIKFMSGTVSGRQFVVCITAVVIPNEIRSLYLGLGVIAISKSFIGKASSFICNTAAC